MLAPAHHPMVILNYMTRNFFMSVPIPLLIPKKIKKLPPGTSFVIHNGVYRLAYMRVSVLLKFIYASCRLLSLCFALFSSVSYAGFSTEQVQVIKEATEEFAVFQKNNFDLFNQLQIEMNVSQKTIAENYQIEMTMMRFPMDINAWVNRIVLNKESPIQFLDWLLGVRLNFLEQRLECLHHDRHQIETNGLDGIITLMYVNDSQEAVGRYQIAGDYLRLNMAQGWIDTYQFINLLIKNVLSFIPKKDLPPQVVLKLRCSIALHPYLEGLEEGVISSSETLDHQEELELYYTYVREFLFGIELKGLGVPSSEKPVPTAMTLDEALEFRDNHQAVTNLNQIAPNRQFIKKYPFTSELFLNYIDSIWKNRNFKHPLPTPNFLNLEQSPKEPQAETPKKATPNCFLPNLPKVHKKSQTKRNPKTNETTLNEALVESTSVFSTNRDLDTDDSTQEGQISNSELPNKTLMEIDNAPSPPSPEVPRKLKVLAKPAESAPSVVLPKKSSRTPRWRKILNGDEQAWIESLFGIRPRLKVVKFRDFSAIWKKLNDSEVNNFNSLKPINRRTTGSHRPLYDSKGNVVGGIFAHGDNQEYGLEYQKYLAKAFADIGVTPKK